jgi:peptidoglycan-associated lipoprotein
VIILTTFSGCGKRVAGSSGDASSTRKSPAAPVETIQPEGFATIPDDKSSFEAMRTPGDMASAPSETSPPSAPGDPAPATAPSAPSSPLDASNLSDIFFDYDQYAIRRDAQTILGANADWIKNRPGKAVVIEGHCDERGTQAYNLVLGDKRARSVKRYLEDLGVPTSRMKTTSYGEIRPSARSETKAVISKTGGPILSCSSPLPRRCPNSLMGHDYHQEEERKCEE